MCEICGGRPGCPVCGEDTTIECTECAGTGHTEYYVGDVLVTRGVYDEVYKLVPIACNFEICPKCKGNGEVSIFD